MTTPTPPTMPKPAWFAVDTSGADFDVSFVMSEEEALDLNDGDPDAAAKITRLYSEGQVRAAIAADRQSASRATPEGWVCVPREPTKEMADAAVRAYQAWSAAEVPWSTFEHSDSYRAMIASAPPAGALTVLQPSVAKSNFQIALENIACEKPRLEAASKLTGSPDRMRCFHCDHAWQPDCKPHHGFGCAYVEAVNALATANQAAEAPPVAIPFAGFDPKFCPGSNPDNPQEPPDFDPVWIDAHPLGTTWHGVGADGDWYTTTEQEYLESVRRGATIGQPKPEAPPVAVEATKAVALTKKQRDDILSGLAALYGDRIKKWERIGDEDRVTDLKAAAFESSALLTQILDSMMEPK